MALAFTDSIKADLILYDCMDELSAFAGLRRKQLEFEKKLFNKADIIFTAAEVYMNLKRSGILCFFIPEQYR